MPSSPAPPRVAVIGCGAWGKNIVRNFAELGALAAIADDQAERLAPLVAQFGASALPAEDAIDDPAIPAIAIATPPVSHARLALRALEAGKHVFVEKPMTMTSAEGETLVAAAKSAGRTLMVGHILRYHAAFLALQRFVAGGAIGEVRHVASNRFGFGAIRRQEDVIWCLAPHDLSMIMALVGEHPFSVTASATAVLRPWMADMAEIGLIFGSGVQARVQVSWLNPFKEHRLTVVGSTGMAVFEDSHPDPAMKLRHYAHAVDWSSGAPRVGHTAQPALIPCETAEPLKAECRHFLDCVATGAAPLTGGAEALAITRIMEQARDIAYRGFPSRPV